MSASRRFAALPAILFFLFVTCGEGHQNPCSLAPCKNKAQCRQVGKGYVCDCRIGHKGKNCTESYVKEPNLYTSECGLFFHFTGPAQTSMLEASRSCVKAGGFLPMHMTHTCAMDLYSRVSQTKFGGEPFMFHSTAERVIFNPSPQRLWKHLPWYVPYGNFGQICAAGMVQDCEAPHVGYTLISVNGFVPPRVNYSRAVTICKALGLPLPGADMLPCIKRYLHRIEAASDRRVWLPGRRYIEFGAELGPETNTAAKAFVLCKKATSKNYDPAYLDDPQVYEDEGV